MEHQDPKDQQALRDHPEEKAGMVHQVKRVTLDLKVLNPALQDRSARRVTLEFPDNLEGRVREAYPAAMEIPDNQALRETRV